MRLLPFLFATSLFAAGPQFTELKCNQVIGDKVVVQVKDETVHYTWDAGAPEKEIVKILRTLADPAIPTSLLGEFDDVKIEIDIPKSSCKFPTVGSFSCDHEEELSIKVTAKVDDFGDEENKPEIYEGTIQNLVLKNKFAGKKDKRTLTFPISFEITEPKKAKITAESGFFFAHFWEADGFNQNPSCKVDGNFLVD